MYIFYLKLYKYVRFKSTNTELFEWSPTKNLMLILGSNGCGKSAVMEELSPIPSSRHNFYKGGIKEIHIFHMGSRYQLVSHYNRGTGEHSFIKDTVELNQGGTFAIQESLCLQEFGLTTELHHLNIGKIKFSKLKVSERKDLLKRMIASTLSLDYTFDKLEEVRIEARSQKGTVSTLSERLVSDNHDIPTDAEMSKMRNDTEYLKKRLNNLFKDKQQKVYSQFNGIDDAKRQLEAIIKRAKDVLYRYPYLPENVLVRDYVEFQAEFLLYRDNYTAVKTIISKAAEDLEKLRNSVPATMEVDPVEMQHLSERITELLKVVNRLTDQINNYQGKLPLVTFDTHGQPHEKLGNLFRRLFESMNAFPDNSDGEISKEKAHYISEQLKVNKAEYQKLDERVHLISNRLMRLKGCVSVQCPKCDHDFQPGVDPTEGTRLESERDILNVKMSHLQESISVDEAYMERYQEYCSHVYNYVQITRDYPEFKQLWTYMGGNNVMFRTPALWKQELLLWNTAMTDYINHAEASVELHKVQLRHKTLNEIDKDAIAYTKTRTEELEHELSVRYTEQQDLHQFLSTLKQCESDIQSNINDAVNVLEEYNSWKERMYQHTEYLIDKALDAEINEVTTVVAEKQRQLSQMEQRDTTIRVLENEVSRAKESHNELNIINKALSPNGGLLGRYLMGFMTGVTTLVNAYIEEIWTYPLEVLASKIEKDELDYKFPLSVANSDNPVPDIDLGSEGQVEIVNFGFLMAIRKFLHLEEMPLYLDEFGRTFDEQHRANSIPFLSRLIENGIVKQIFYISHFSSTHGAFNQAEVVVLDPTNITLPQAYNKNVVIK